MGFMLDNPQDTYLLNHDTLLTYCGDCSSDKECKFSYFLSFLAVKSTYKFGVMAHGPSLNLRADV